MSLNIPSAPSWHDTAEFAAVGKLLTTSHAPGHPLYTILTSGWGELLPIGNYAFRTTCFSALCLLLSFLVLCQAAGGFREQRWSEPIWIAAVLISPPILSQAVRSEVYGLTLLLSSGVAWAWLCWWKSRDLRYFYLCAFAVGLGGANHSFLALIPVPIVFATLMIRGLNLRIVVTSITSGLAGLGAYSLLCFRSIDSEYGWGMSDDWAGFWHMISAKDWTKSIEVEGVSVFEQAVALCLAMVDGLGATAFCLWFTITLWGGAVAFLERRIDALILLIIGLSFPLVRGILDVDVQNPDLMGYLCSGIAIAALGTLLALRQVNHSLRILFLFGTLLFLGTTAFSSNGPTDSEVPERYARRLISEVPVDGGVLVSNYSTWFWTWYLRGVEGFRPDVAVVFRGRVGQEWHQRRVQQSFPELAYMMKAYPDAFFRADFVWEPGVLLPEQLGTQKFRPMGLTFGLTEGTWEPVSKQTFEEVFRRSLPRDLNHEAYLRFEWLRFAELVGLDPEYGHFHKARLRELGLSPGDHDGGMKSPEL